MNKFFYARNRTVSKACEPSLSKITSLKTFIEIKKIKFYHKNCLQRVDTENFDLYIKELIRAKILDNYEDTNLNFESFFVNNFISKHARTNFYTAQFLTGHGPFYLAEDHPYTMRNLVSAKTIQRLHNARPVVMMQRLHISDSVVMKLSKRSMKILLRDMR